MDGQAEAALEAADMVLEEVWVLVEVDSLQRKLTETFTAIGIGSGSRCDTSATEFGTCTVLRALAFDTAREGELFLPDSPWLLVNRVSVN